MQTLRTPPGIYHIPMLQFAISNGTKAQKYCCDCLHFVEPNKIKDTQLMKTKYELGQAQPQLCNLEPKA